MTEERFDWLEDSTDLPAEVQAAIQSLNRFDALEIGAVAQAPAPKLSPPPPPAEASPPTPPQDGTELRCVHCGQINEREREVCWACHKFVRAQAAASAPGKDVQDITIVLDGVTYSSRDPGIPDDVRVLMDRIRREGYSPALLADWNAWRAQRHSLLSAPPPPTAPIGDALATIGMPPQGGKEVEVFRGQRVSVLRVDGKVYRSDDAANSAEMRKLFDFLGRNGPTPALMEYLRQFGGKVKYRPSDTVKPSDGDVAFWQDPQVQDLVARRRPEVGPPSSSTPPPVPQVGDPPSAAQESQQTPPETLEDFEARVGGRDWPRPWWAPLSGQHVRSFGVPLLAGFVILLALLVWAYVTFQ